MFMRLIIRILKLWKCILLGIIILFVIPKLIIELKAKNKIFKLDEAPNAPIAIVFGAGLNRDGSPTPILRDRVSTAVSLYENGNVEKLLMSGDNRFEDYNEPAAMRDYAITLGVEPEDIVLDYAGRRTYDTCYRAKFIFGIKDALLITQRFHLPRSLFICDELGINANGVEADRRTYFKSSYIIWNTRELFATMVAVWDIFIEKPLPVLGKPEPIIFKD
ncbi:MAG: YdcF family protein [Anaerolineaceae bacterium]|nr:YdcF family protein [Anaerolineaceae bacterium]